MDKAGAIEAVKFLQALVELSEVDILLATFIPAFREYSVLKDDGVYYLHGGFNLGGTKTGRLSSSKPNLTSIPSGSVHAKLIKECFISTADWLFCGADFNSLEDMISALTTKDKNKLKVYTDGYDGHCLRAYSYFRDQLPDIVDTVASINSIKTKYPQIRQDSKTPTFALTYSGTWHTLVKNLGMTKEKAQDVEANYHTLYVESDEYIQGELHQACKDGYITGAFGLRLRTPMLSKVMLGTSKTPYEAEAEARTAGNMKGQSYCMLNNRAGIEMLKRILASPYRYDIKPNIHIHDAQYFLVRPDIEVVTWFNKNLVECMQWQDLPELQHPTVRLGGATDIFYPNWSCSTTLPNNASGEAIEALFYEEIHE